MDTLTEQRLNTLHPAVRESAFKVVNDANNALTGRAQVRVTQALRTFKEQDALYAQGRTTPGQKVTNARGGSSWHNYGLAFDFVLILDGKEISWSLTEDYDGDHKADWMEVVAIAKANGWQWGGEWKSLKDYPHFEKTNGLDLSTAFDRYKNGQFIQGNYIKL